MRAITLPTFGDPDVLTLAEVPDPRPGPGEVLIDIVAAALNRADVLQRMGLYPPPPDSPAYPGLECSGRISALGDGVTGWKVGDEVCALLAGGGYADKVAVPAGHVLPVPKGVSLIEAAGLPEATCTVWFNLFMLSKLARGEVLLIHGGTSGVGTTAIQLAARHGARVFATAGSPRKVERCRELGADVAIDYRREDFVDRVRDATDGHGADVILDIMGATYLPRNIDVLAIGGRLAVIGTQGGRTGDLDLRRLLHKQGTVTATSLRVRAGEDKARIVAAVRESVWPAIESGEFRPVVDRTIPLIQVSDAHRVMESSEHIGKIVLTIEA